jgi:hypothetical protein
MSAAWRDSAIAAHDARASDPLESVVGLAKKVGPTQEGQGMHRRLGKGESVAIAARTAILRCRKKTFNDGEIR